MVRRGFRLGGGAGPGGQSTSMGTLFRWSGLIGAAALAFACGSSSSGGLNGNDTSGDGSDASTTGSSGGGSGSGSGGGGSSSSTFGGSSGGTAMGTGTCQTGNYSGMFSCLFYYGVDAGIGNAPDSGGLGPITGTMSFMLTQDISSQGEIGTTDTASGTFLATTGGFIAAAANLQGTLNCSQGKFTGQLVNGEYGFNIGGMPAPDPNNKFQGPLVSDYNGSTSTFANGQWSMFIAGEGPCIGTWTATYSGPLDAGAGTDARAPADATGE
jgi:hypothetical protein